MNTESTQISGSRHKQKLTRTDLLRYGIQGAVLGVLATSGVFLYTQEAQTFADLASFRWEFVLLLFPMIITAWLCNGARVYILSRSLGYPLTYLQSLSVSLSTEFGIAATPAGVGGTVIRLSLLHRGGVPVAHGASMLAIDVVVDCLFFALLLPLTFYALLHAPVVRNELPPIDGPRFLAMLLVVALFVGALAFAVKSGLVVRFIRALAQWHWAEHHRMPARVRWYEWRFVKEFVKMKEGVKHIYKLKRGVLLLNFLLASIQWTCRYGALPLILFAFSIDHQPVFFFLLQGVLFTLSLMIVLPGGGGGVELLSFFVLSKMIPPHLVGVVILLWRFFTYHMYLFVGGAMFFYTCLRIHTLFPGSALTDAAVEFEDEFDDQAEEEAA